MGFIPVILAVAAATAGPDPNKENIFVTSIIGSGVVHPIPGSKDALIVPVFDKGLHHVEGEHPTVRPTLFRDWAIDRLWMRPGGRAWVTFRRDGVHRVALLVSDSGGWRSAGERPADELAHFEPSDRYLWWYRPGDWRVTAWDGVRAFPEQVLPGKVHTLQPTQEGEHALTVCEIEGDERIATVFEATQGRRTRERLLPGGTLAHNPRGQVPWVVVLKGDGASDLFILDRSGRLISGEVRDKPLAVAGTPEPGSYWVHREGDPPFLARTRGERLVIEYPGQRFPLWALDESGRQLWLLDPLDRRLTLYDPVLGGEEVFEATVPETVVTVVASRGRSLWFATAQGRIGHVSPGIREPIAAVELGPKIDGMVPMGRRAGRSIWPLQDDQTAFILAPDGVRRATVGVDGIRISGPFGVDLTRSRDLVRAGNVHPAGDRVWINGWDFISVVGPWPSARDEVALSLGGVSIEGLGTTEYPLPIEATRREFIRVDLSISRSGLLGPAVLKPNPIVASSQVAWKPEGVAHLWLLRPQGKRFERLGASRTVDDIEESIWWVRNPFQEISPPEGSWVLRLSYQENDGTRFQKDYRLVLRPGNSPLTRWWFSRSAITRTILAYLVTAAALLAASRYARGGSPLLRRWFPLGAWLVPVTLGVLGRINDLGVNGYILTAMLGGSLILVMGLGLLSPEVFLETSEAAPFHWIAPLSLQFLAVRRRLLAPYLEAVEKRSLVEKGSAFNEDYISLPAEFLESGRSRMLPEPARFLVQQLMTDEHGPRTSAYIEAPGGTGKSALFREVMRVAAVIMRRDLGRIPV